jgi:perosamine synthetase
MTRKDYLPFGRPNFSEREIAAVTEVLRSGWIGMGAETQAFERELADALGAPEVVTVSSCTAALFLSLRVLGVGASDEVICPSFTWCSTANSALYLGATPVFCDIDARTLCLDPSDLLAKVTPRTRAVVVVHFGGLAVDVAGLRAKLPSRVHIIEDAAHAFGARYPDGRLVGSSGHLVCFSFYANKNLSTGEGGAVALFDRQLADRLRSLRLHGQPIDAWKRYTHPHSLLWSEPLTELGYKMNYTDLQAALGRVQLVRQPEFAATRAAIARCYVDGLSDLDPPLVFQDRCTHASHARHLFVAQLPTGELGIDRNEIVRRLRARNIGASVHYAPLHTMPLYLNGRAAPALPVTERVAEHIVTLPISASMTIDDARDVVQALQDELADAGQPLRTGQKHAL